MHFAAHLHFLRNIKAYIIAHTLMVLSLKFECVNCTREYILKFSDTLLWTQHGLKLKYKVKRALITYFTYPFEDGISHHLWYQSQGGACHNGETLVVIPSANHTRLYSYFYVDGVCWLRCVVSHHSTNRIVWYISGVISTSRFVVRWGCFYIKL